MMGREPQGKALSRFKRERAEGEGLLFGENEVFENKNRRPVNRERPGQVTLSAAFLANHQSIVHNVRIWLIFCVF